MNSKEKFSNKVSDYIKYRPTYPKEFINYLENELGFSKNSVIADIGAGTGILSNLLADKVKKIYAVEPNYNMRSACKEYCQGFNNFTTVDGSAEETGLPNYSVDFITVAQAFHWFDRDKSKIEFNRILRPNGKVVLVWNSRVTGNTFIKENDKLCRRVCPEFIGFSGGIGNGPELFSDFFKNGLYDSKVFENDRRLSLEEYIGSSLSASYAPAEGDENYQQFIDELTELFEKHSSDGIVLLPNKTRSYVGKI
ncbi:class I SAM-dependent methyltransferase [Desulfosporosinus sp. FKA]|uniref:class I SAM-dependent methyltransferase n=1 Tax=Desulfosporosinus sp. FKA TaxID=1969834 RepID=UPI000B4A47B4|nr:class I SAM-dependent methyltransferase [Desulfosporosinus sp. FKA]